MTKEMYTSPQLVVVEFGEEDVVCSSGNFNVDKDITSGDDDDVWD